MPVLPIGFRHSIACEYVRPDRNRLFELSALAGRVALVGALLDDDVFEPVPYLTEAIAHLAGCRARDRTGQILTSQQLLRELGHLPP